MQLRELDANLLVVLDALLMESSVTKAAEKLGRSPSAISHSLNNLRSLFDDELFVRAGQRLVPTPRVQELAPTVHVIVSGIESLLHPTDPFDPRTEERTFTFACREACELTLLDRVRGSIDKSAPGIRLTWRQFEGENSLAAMRDGLIQFIIVEGERPDETADYHWARLHEEPLVTYTGKVGQGAEAEISGISSFLQGEHILVVASEATDDLLEPHMQRAGIVRREQARTSSVFAALYLAQQHGVQVTLPQSVAGLLAGKFDLEVVAQPFEQISIPVHIGWHRSLERDECHHWLRERIMEVAQEFSAQ